MYFSSTSAASASSSFEQFGVDGRGRIGGDGGGGEVGGGDGGVVVVVVWNLEGGGG